MIVAVGTNVRIVVEPASASIQTRTVLAEGPHAGEERWGGSLYFASLEQAAMALMTKYWMLVEGDDAAELGVVQVVGAIERAKMAIVAALAARAA